MTTKELRREKRLRLIVEAMERWREKLKKATKTQGRALRALDKLERARVRAQRMMKAETQVESPVVAPLPTNFFAATALPDHPVPDDIPTFLQREPSKNDEQARAEIEAQQAADKKRKAELSAEKRKVKQEVRDADLTGLRRKMPLTGRAALDALK